jgi:peptidoglycan-N-acetylglucosamine deacetylase
LLHDGSSARNASGRPVVLEALPRLLDALAERSLRAVALPEPGPRA